MAQGKLDAIGIVVSDLKRAVEFYRALGVPFEPGMEDSEHGHAEAELDGGLRLMLDSEAGIREFDPNWQRGKGASGASLAFRCESPQDVDQLYAAALAAGATGHHAPWDAFWGQRYAQVRDHDGNPIDIYADLERS